MDSATPVQVSLDVQERARLRWQCRRGMRELDELLQPFVRRYLDTMTANELQVLRQLLACPDQRLLACLMLQETPEDQGWVDVINKIRASAAD